MPAQGLLLLHVGMRFWGIITRVETGKPDCFTFRHLARKAEPKSCSLAL